MVRSRSTHIARDSIVAICSATNPSIHLRKNTPAGKYTHTRTHRCSQRRHHQRTNKRTYRFALGCPNERTPPAGTHHTTPVVRPVPVAGLVSREGVITIEALLAHVNGEGDDDNYTIMWVYIYIYMYDGFSKKAAT